MAPMLHGCQGAASHRCMLCRSWGAALPALHKSQELGDGTAHRHLVTLPLARVQSDKSSGGLEEPVLVEVNSLECSLGLFIVLLTPNKVQPAGTAQLSNRLGRTARCQQRLWQRIFMPSC